jgi:hypothetical protein
MLFVYMLFWSMVMSIALGGMLNHAVMPTILLTDYTSMLRPARVN